VTGPSLVQISRVNPEILELLSNIAEGSRNVRFYQFRNNHWYPFGDGTKINRHFHWHTCRESGAAFSPTEKDKPKIILPGEEFLLDNGQIFEIPSHTLHFVHAIDGTVMINWHEGSSVVMPEHALRRNRS